MQHPQCHSLVWATATGKSGSCEHLAVVADVGPLHAIAILTSAQWEQWGPVQLWGSCLGFGGRFSSATNNYSKLQSAYWSQPLTTKLPQTLGMPRP